jgi:hypothetical protein
MIVGGLVMLFIEAILLVGHGASLPFWSQDQLRGTLLTRNRSNEVDLSSA